MEVNDCLAKYKLIVEKLFERKIVIDDYLAETMLNFLEVHDDNSLGKLMLNKPEFSDIIFHYIEKINTASTSLKLFLIETVIILFKNELPYINTQMQSYQTLAYKACNQNLSSNPPPNLHLACIKLATIQLTHRSGLNLIIDQKLWHKILFPNIHHKAKQISNAAYDFMAKLVWKLIECYMEPPLLEVLGYIVEPIHSVEYNNVPVLDTDTDTALSDKIFSHLSALLAMLSKPIDNVMNNEHITKIMSLLKEYYFVDHALYGIFIATKKTCLSKLLDSCLFLYTFHLHRHLLHDKKVDEFCNKMTAYHRNYLVMSVKKRNPFAIVDYSIQCTVTLSKFKKIHAHQINFPLTFERNGQIIEYSLQLMIYLLVPQLTYASFERLKSTQSDVLELFALKMGKTVTEFIFSSCYLFAQLLEEGGEALKKEVTIYTLKDLQRLKGHINETQAGPLFQSLYYLLDNFVLCNGAELVVNENPVEPDDLRLLSHLLEAMKMLLKEHNIPWYENLEIVNIQADLLNLLKQISLTSKHVVQVLDLINICVKKFLSPNMSLLVENTSKQDSTLNAIGEVMKLYMQHDDWEIRDSALNLLNICTEICFIKYIPLQKLIAENRLIILAANVALTDKEFYSQCTALKCLTAATKIDAIWQEVLADNENLYLHLVHILRNNSEGMVRKEAAQVLTGVYVNQKLPPRCQNTLYEVMLSAAIDDLHWEVQIAALNFWKCAIQNQLTYTGMIDRKFPPVTFSKEKRKIVILNKSEIQRQLTAIMNHLSNIGCLTALLECMSEINSIDVTDRAHCIARELIEMLDEYNFEELIGNVEPKLIERVEIPRSYKEENNINLDSNCAKSEEERDTLIDDILIADKNELILNLHDSYCEMKSNEMDIELSYYPRKELVQPDRFLEHFKRNDYSTKIVSKQICSVDGVGTLERLLDDILDLEMVT